MICCVVPRKSLQTQCEEVFMDPFFKKLFGVNLSVRASTNDRSPCRGMNGFVTTFQALGHDKHRYVRGTVSARRTIVILDEFHHVEKDSPWHQAVDEIIDAATYVIFMSGTLSRANKKKIACVKYKGGYVDLDGDKNTYVIRYSRTTALREQAILPIMFHLHDGSFEWKALYSDKTTAVSSFDQVKPSDRSSALFTALQTEFSNQLIDQTLSHWLQLKGEQPRSKVLFVCARIRDARKCMDYLKDLGIPALLATSHESAECVNNIAAFKQRAPVLVTIAVAYEGLDVPPVTHVCILTRIRSSEWLEQCVSRATRWDKLSGPYRSQQAHIFAPKDPAFMEFVSVVEKEQVTRAMPTIQKEEQLPLFEIQENGGENGREKGPCIPLRSEILEMSKKVLGGAVSSWERVIQTPKQEETTLRRDIDRYLKNYANDQGYEIQHLNKEVKSINGKPRGDMTLAELKHLFNRVQTLYPLKSKTFIPISNCQPVFTSQPKPFNLKTEHFF